VAEDLARIQRIWVDLRTQNRERGEFLFGPFCIADAMFAPVVSRLMTYHVEVEPLAAQYMESIGALPGMRDWTAAAQRESWVVPSDEIDFLPAPPAH
jgi:glutathione S-transferase